MNKDTVTLYVRNRDGVVFEGKIKALSSKNSKGQFDVLFEHANFISLVEDILYVETEGGEKKEIPVESAVMRVRNNRIEVYVGIKR